MWFSQKLIIFPCHLLEKHNPGLCGQNMSTWLSQYSLPVKIKGMVNWNTTTKQGKMKILLQWKEYEKFFSAIPLLHPKADSYAEAVHFCSEHWKNKMFLNKSSKYLIIFIVSSCNHLPALCLIITSQHNSLQCIETVNHFELSIHDQSTIIKSNSFNFFHLGYIQHSYMLQYPF